jgi:hypothetical protein
MPGCYKCGHHASRHHRGVLLKIISRASFHCSHCGANSNFYRPAFAIFQRWCQCPLCHNRQLALRGKADKIDRRTPNPLRRLLGLFGFPIYHCTFCRYQFRDWRKLDPNREGPARSATIAEDGFKV